MKILTAEFEIPGYKKKLVDVKELMLTNETNFMMKRYDKLDISMNGNVDISQNVNIGN